MDLVALARRTRWEMLGFDFKPTERRMADLFLLLTFDCGKESKVIPYPQNQLATLLNIDDGELTKTFKSLERARFLIRSSVGVGGAIEYRIDPDPSSWVAVRIQKRRELIKHRSELDQVPHQRELPFESEPLKVIIARMGLAKFYSEPKDKSGTERAVSQSSSWEIPNPPPTSSVLPTVAGREIPNVAPPIVGADAPASWEIPNPKLPPQISLRSEIIFEVPNSELMRSHNSRVKGDEPQLKGRDKARQEEAYTQAAMSVAASYRHDPYIMEKLSRAPALREELMAGRTPTARKFAVFYQQSSDEARELLGTVVQIRPNPRAYLNARVRHIRY